MSGASVQRRLNTLISVREIFWKRSGRGSLQWEVTLLGAMGLCSKWIQDSNADPVWVLLQPVLTQWCSSCFRIQEFFPTEFRIQDTDPNWIQGFVAACAYTILWSNTQIAVIPLKFFPTEFRIQDTDPNLCGGKWQPVVLLPLVLNPHTRRILVKLLLFLQNLFQLNSGLRLIQKLWGWQVVC